MTGINDILRQKSLRITPMRQLVLRHFFETEKTLGLSELEEALPKSDRITIYRTLKTFEEKGILHTIQNGTAEVKYALCKEFCKEERHLDRHPHFHCMNCKQIECLETILIPEIRLPGGYSSKEITMTIKGVCQQCNTIA